MSIGEICNREVIIANKENSIFEAAQLMREHHVGDVVVVEQRGEQRVPVGILTDRDIVIEIVAKAVDAQSVTVGEAMSSDLLTAEEGDQLTDLIQQMQGKGVRRVPIVNSSGGLVGIVTVDDLIDLMADQLTSLVGLIQREEHREEHRRT